MFVPDKGNSNESYDENNKSKKEHKKKIKVKKEKVKKEKVKKEKVNKFIRKKKEVENNVSNNSNENEFILNQIPTSDANNISNTYGNEFISNQMPKSEFENISYNNYDNEFVNKQAYEKKKNSYDDDDELNNKKRKIIVILIVLVILFFAIFLFGKNIFFNYQNNDAEIIVMLGDVNGVFSKSEDNTFPPKDLYTYNKERSVCVDSREKELSNSLDYNVELQKVKVKNRKAKTCYLYFDLNASVPQEFIFYLGKTLEGKSNDDYVNTKDVLAYISWTDDDIVSYCITKENNSDDCKWNSVNDEKYISTEYTLEGEDGIKFIFAYLKNKAGVISDKVVDIITLDTTAPVIKDASLKNATTNSLTIEVNADDENGIKKYSYSIDGKTYFDGEETYTLKGLTHNTTYKVYVKATDIVENQSKVFIKEFKTVKKSESIPTPTPDPNPTPTPDPKPNPEPDPEPEVPAPIIKDFYLTETSSGNIIPKYINYTEINAHISWNIKEVVSYCIQESSNSNSCTWNSVGSATSIKKKFSLVNGDKDINGEHTIYAFIKNKDGKISSSKTQKVIYDNFSPMINKIDLREATDKSITISVSAWENMIISSYYYSIVDKNVYNPSIQDYKSSKSSQYTFDNLDPSTIYVISVKVLDAAGNVNEATAEFSTKAKPEVCAGTIINGECAVSAYDMGWYYGVENYGTGEVCGCKKSYTYDSCAASCASQYSCDSANPTTTSCYNYENCLSSCPIGDSCLEYKTCQHKDFGYTNEYYCAGGWKELSGTAGETLMCVKK